MSLNSDLWNVKRWGRQLLGMNDFAVTGLNTTMSSNVCSKGTRWHERFRARRQPCLYSVVEKVHIDAMMVW